jgi:phosphatidate cytidylyltransferase
MAEKKTMLFAAIYFGSNLVFAIIVMVLIAGGIAEYNTMVLTRGDYLAKGIGLVVGLLVPAAAFFGNAQFMYATMTFGIIIIFLLYLFTMKDRSLDVAVLAKVVFGLVYIPVMLSHIILIRASDNGLVWVFFIIILAFSGDVSAFYVGKTFGKRKLMPTVSAGKTVEGTLGLIAGSVAGCLIFKFLFLQGLTVMDAAVLGFLGGILGQLGDLCESTIKRASMVKDSGFLFPGHGGVLDRLDSLIFIIPFVYYYKLFAVQ